MEGLVRPVVLVGYMAAGKSTTARRLAQIWSIPSLDLDHLIEQNTGLSPADWLRNKGEVAFRKAEAAVLRELNWTETFVLASGGGTPCYAGNMDFMRQHALIVYLQWPVSVLVDRLRLLRSSRPLLDGVADDYLPAYVGAHLLERNHFYGQASLRVLMDPHESEAESAERVRLACEEALGISPGVKP